MVLIDLCDALPPSGPIFVIPNRFLGYQLEEGRLLPRRSRPEPPPPRLNEGGLCNEGACEGRNLAEEGIEFHLFRDSHPPRQKRSLVGLKS